MKQILFSEYREIEVYLQHDLDPIQWGSTRPWHCPRHRSCHQVNLPDSHLHFLFSEVIRYDDIFTYIYHLEEFKRKNSIHYYQEIIMTTHYTSLQQSITSRWDAKSVFLYFYNLMIHRKKWGQGWKIFQ